MSNSKIIVVRGTAHWCKLLGAPRPHTGLPKYDKGPFWSIDVTPDEKSRKIIEDAGISDKLRKPKGEKETRKETFLTLRQLLKKSDGSNNKPPLIVNIQNQPWGDAEIGNGSIVDVKIKVVDYGAGSDKGAYLQSTRVLQHVAYDGGSGFEELSEDDEFFAAATEGKPAEGNAKADNPDELDDEIPF